MVLDIDQFGRNTSKNNTSSLNKENSKKILDSLAEIKNINLQKKLIILKRSKNIYFQMGINEKIHIQFNLVPAGGLELPT